LTRKKPFLILDFVCQNLSCIFRTFNPFVSFSFHNMNVLLLYGYATAVVGMAISVLYFGLNNFSQHRNLRLLLDSTVFRQIYERRRNHPLEHKYANRHRTKLITRRLLNKINQLNPRIHLPSEVPRWKLIHTAGGEVRAIPLAP
uniref:Uncharacterized protein n=1 Tax=Anopheles atroparvus TaxID=41427 RepID=A0A182J1G9_ANOAO